MALRGDRRNVDTQIQDLIAEDSQYGFIPGDLPVFHMGKLADTKKDINDFNKDDIAQSLVSLFVYNIINSVIQVCLSEKVFNVITILIF